MADIEIGDLEVRLSGGASNTDPTASLGGIKSSEVVLSQSSTSLTNVTGVVIDNVIGAPVGDGVLNFHFVAVAQVQTLTIDAALVTSNQIAVDVDGVTVSTVFATDSNTTLAALATLIQAESGVVTAVVTDAGGGTDDDRVIVITANTAGTVVLLENEAVTLGASQAGITQDVTTGNQAVDSLRWTPLSGGAVDGVDVSSDGTYTIPGSDGSLLVVTVTAASLPASTDQNDTTTIANIANELFDDISKAESAAGDTEYRGFYIHNVHGTDTAFSVTIWLKQDSTGPDAITISVDAAGVGDGASTGVMQTIANESTAPATGTFTSPSTQATGLDLGDLAASQSAGFWIKRIIPSSNTTSAPNAISKIGISSLM